VGFLMQAQFPERKVSLVAVDKRLKTGMENKLKRLGLEILKIPPYNRLQSAVSGHPDMQMVHIRGNIIVCHRHIPKAILEHLQKRGFVIFFGDSILSPEYPSNVAYNVAIIGDVAFHNTNHTDPVLKQLLEKCSIRLVHVRQGYSKCSVLAVTPKSVITADPTIAKAAEKEGFDVLKILPQRNICLPGLDYGFIGGTAGFIGKNMLAFTGRLEELNESEKISAFLKKYGVQWVNLGDKGIYDYGGLLPLYQ
jgi:hypothetical protein